MDTNATLARILDAIEEGDYDEARAGIRDLRHWLHRGGAMPTISASDLLYLLAELADMNARYFA